MLEGRDLVAQAETGSGKTAAFAIGILNKLDATVFRTQALVICPTRELSDQVAAELRRLASGLANTRVLTLCGGKPMHEQLISLKREPHIVVGTPGRLKKHLEKGTLHLGRVRTLVLDEADRMLDMGFHDDIVDILASAGADRQTLLFSATYPDRIARISRTVQRNPVEVRLAGTGAGTGMDAGTAGRIEQVFIATTGERKQQTLLRTLGRYRPDRAIIFCNRRVHAQSLCDALGRRGVSSRALHGDLEQRDRDEAMILFANRSISCLIATDVAARGLDIDALPMVISHDLSPDPETHVHRIGRTGRAGLEGVAVSLVCPDEMHRVRAIEAFTGVEARFEEMHASDGDGGPVPAPATRTLQINLGKKDKIRPGDIVGALTAGSAMSNDDIGRITVQAKVSFVAVNAASCEVALNLLSRGRVKKRTVRARLLDPAGRDG